MNKLNPVNSTPIKATDAIRTFAINVRNMRAANAMNKATFAAVIGVCGPTIARIERAVRKPKRYNPNTRTILRFAKAAEVSLTDITTTELVYESIQ